jgi:hypothetical protein
MRDDLLWTSIESQIAEDEDPSVCKDCDGTRLVWESCACNDCEYDVKHSRWVACASCSPAPREKEQG